MEKKNEQKHLIIAFKIIVGLIVIVGVLSVIFWASKPQKIVNGFDCSRHQEEIIHLCKEEQDCSVLDECMKYYDENEALEIEYILSDSYENISDMSSEPECANFSVEEILPQDE